MTFVSDTAENFIIAVVNQTITADGNNITANESVCDETDDTRITTVSIGSTLAGFGCFFNTILLYVLLRKTKKSYPFQIFLAFLDFMLCALYIHCFGLLTLAVEMRIGFLYHFIMDTHVFALVVSRVVQLSIPYTLIANSADKMLLITGRKIDSRKGLRFRVKVIIFICSVITLLRVTGFRTLEISEDPNCDTFHSKWLSQRQLSPKEAKMWAFYENALTFCHTFVSFVILVALNIFVVCRLRVEHRKTRRQSTSPAQLFAAAQAIREQQHLLRCAVKTTVVIITAYLCCNSINFILYLLESFERSMIYEENGLFKPTYVFISDVGSNLFVLSSAIRIFIYYKYNSDMKEHLKDTFPLKNIIRAWQKRKTGILLKKKATLDDKVDV